MLYYITVRLNHVVYFQNRENLEHFVAKRYLPRSKCVLVNGSGIDLDEWSFHEAPTRPLTFVCVSRLLGEKGIREFVDAASQIKRGHPDVRFVLVGNTDSNPDAVREAEINQWRQAGVVECVGFVQDVRPYLINSSVFVLPSYYREGLPRSSIEALAIGRPIITTREPGCREVISVSDPNGFLIDARNVQMLVDAMMHFVREPGIVPNMARASRRLAESRFDVQSVNRVILEHLRA